MKNFSYSKSNSNMKKCLILAAVLILFIALFIPVWNFGVKHSMDKSMEKAEETETTLDYEERALKAKAAELKTREQIETYLVAYNVER